MRGRNSIEKRELANKAAAEARKKPGTTHEEEYSSDSGRETDATDGPVATRAYPDVVPDDNSNNASSACCKKKSSCKKKCRQENIGQFLNKAWCKFSSLTWREILQYTVAIATLVVLAAVAWEFRDTICHYITEVGKFFGIQSTSSAIDEALSKYSADRLGMADYALESVGGTVLCNSPTYFLKNNALYTIFGIPIWYHTSSPREVIHHESQPGMCWAMDGQDGFITVQLAMPIIVSEVSLEHIDARISPTGHSDSALKDFEIWGKTRDMGSVDILLGKFTYQITGKPIQEFKIKNPDCLREKVCGGNDNVFRIITLKVLTNHGNPDFTCIYRLRVHGKPAMEEDLLH